MEKLMSPDTYYIALYDEDSQVITFEVFIESRQPRPRMVMALSEGGLTGRIIQSRQPLLVQDWLAEPRLTFIRGTNSRFATGYSFDTKRNDTAFHGGQKAVSNALNFETKYNVLRSASVEAKFTFNTIDFTTTHAVNGANSTVGYIMLNGLLPGKNYLWNLSFTKTLLNNLELRFEYEGRKPGDARTVHRGTASLNALF